MTHLFANFLDVAVLTPSRGELINGLKNLPIATPNPAFQMQAAAGVQAGHVFETRAHNTRQGTSPPNVGQNILEIRQFFERISNRSGVIFRDNNSCDIDRAVLKNVCRLESRSETVSIFICRSVDSEISGVFTSIEKFFLPPSIACCSLDPSLVCRHSKYTAQFPQQIMCKLQQLAL